MPLASSGLGDHHFGGHGHNRADSCSRTAPARQQFGTVGAEPGNDIIDVVDAVAFFKELGLELEGEAPEGILVRARREDRLTVARSSFECLRKSCSVSYL
jgi:hypothetical protein